MQEYESKPLDETEDFLSSDDVSNDDPGETGPNLQLVNDMKPRQLAKSIMAVYRELGGDAWLLTQARENPKEFLGILKTILPKNVDLNIDQEVFVQIAGRQIDATSTHRVIAEQSDNGLVTIQ